MPNHFHFFIHANHKTVMNDRKGRNVLSEGFKNLLSSYAKAINVQKKRTGSLFTQNTHGKNVTGKIKHAFSCFHYIHQNPLRAGLVDRIEDWHYSSFRNYCGLRNGTMCNKNLARKLFDFNDENFYSLSYGVIQNDFLKNIF